MTPQEYCQQKAAQSGSSFYYAFLFLPPPRRAAITALYAFCREVDDIVDECSDTSLAHTKLDWWRGELKRLYANLPPDKSSTRAPLKVVSTEQPSHPVALALQPCLLEFHIEHKHLLAIIDGMEMDLVQNRYLDFKALEKYCWHVAGVVGLLSAGIFGHTQPQTLEYAEKLGLAFQLTNIIRDVGEDARIGRIYLPVNELQRFGVPAADILNARYSPGFVELMKFQTERARAAYDEAFALLPQQDRRMQRPGIIMAKIYRTLLDEIEHENFQVLHQRIALTPLRKLLLAWRTWVGTR